MAFDSFTENIKSIIADLPEKPGVYQFFDKSGKIIYVGKAKNLKKRVSSYFLKQQDRLKTTILVKKINDLQYIVVATEDEALLLENNLIKEYQPRYNVLLKDDKTYPWIVIKNEKFPRIFQTRNVIKDGSVYFGPYSSIVMLRTMLELIKQLFPLRTCNLLLTQDQISKKKYKVCLEYHIGNCKGPCINEQNEEEYEEYIKACKNILRGNISQVIKYLKDLMQDYASKLKFEDAQIIKEKLQLLERYQSRHSVVSPTITNTDVYSILDDTDAAYVNFLKVVDGCIIQSHTLEIKKKLDEPIEELLILAITEIRQRIFSNSREIIVPFPLEFDLQDITFHIPQRGDKKQLLELSERNLKYFKQERLKQLQRVDPEKHTNRILETMRKDLQLEELPRHIECFDNSNIQGHYPVAACVVFKNAKPSKKDYRHFNIKTVEGPNDFASMEEVLKRRYSRLLNENEELPQLVIVDGGKGQLSSAVKIFRELGIYDKVSLIGIAKKLEEIFFPDDPIPLYLDKNSESLKVIQHLRNEAHRFGITHHRNRRSNDFIKSELDSIKGIGTKTVELLLSTFGSVENIRNADEEKLISLIGTDKTKRLLNHFNMIH